MGKLTSRREFLGTGIGGLAVAGIQPRVQASQETAGGDHGLLRAGAATSNITPHLTVPLDGIIGRRGPASHIHDELHARCLVLDNGQERIAFVVCDSTMIGKRVFDEAKRLVHKHTGLPVDRILASATHSHSVPNGIEIVRSPLPWPQAHADELKQYQQFLSRRIADGIRRAINNLEPAQIGWGKANLPDQVFNRRWHMTPGTIPENPFGKSGDKVQMNPPPGSPNLLRPAGPTDPEISIVSVRSMTGRPIAILANYSLHYVGGVPRGHVSADYFGVFAERIRELIGAEYLDPPFVGILSNGTSGDVNNINFQRERQPAEPFARMREVADAVAARVHQVYQGLGYADHVPLAMRERRIELGVRLPSEDEIRWAEAIMAQASSDQSLTRPQIYAQETILMSRWAPVFETVVQAIRIGDLGIAALPCEVFAETGLEIKVASPFKPSFTIQLANDYGGYLPTPRQHQLGGYETWRARSSFLEIEAAPKLVAHVLEMLLRERNES